MVYQRGIFQLIILPKQCVLTYYRQPHNILLMPIVRKQDYQIICELVLEERLGISLLFIISHM
jgi:hypothetical protein